MYFCACNAFRSYHTIWSLIFITWLIMMRFYSYRWWCCSIAVVKPNLYLVSWIVRRGWYLHLGLAAILGIGGTSHDHDTPMTVAHQENMKNTSHSTCHPTTSLYSLPWLTGGNSLVIVSQSTSLILVGSPQSPLSLSLMFPYAYFTTAFAISLY